MKIVFDNEVQKERLKALLADSDYCPSSFGLKDEKECCPLKNCGECWRNALEKAEWETEKNEYFRVYTKSGGVLDFGQKCDVINTEDEKLLIMKENIGGSEYKVHGAVPYEEIKYIERMENPMQKEVQKFNKLIK